MEKKIYVVTTGIYSDYHICAIFSTREKAEKFVDSHGTEYRIEEYPMDDRRYEKNREVKLWRIDLLWKSGEIQCASVVDIMHSVRTEPNIFQYYRDSQRIPRMTMYLMSESMEKVKKIASERLHQIKALHEVKYPLMMEPCTVAYADHFEYPRYDFFTGEIVLFEGLDPSSDIEAPIRKIGRK